MKKFAFTLAEVLLTLTIVGVISAMTVPALINSTEEKNLISRAQKAYNTLQNAVTMKQVLTELSPADVQNNELLRYFLSVHNGNVVTKNGQAVLKNVWSSESGGGVISFADGQVWTVPTVDVAVEEMESSCNPADADKKRYQLTCDECHPCYLQVDLNGAGGPNICAPNQKWNDTNDASMKFCYFNATKAFSQKEYERSNRDIIFFEIRGMNVRPYLVHGNTRRYFGRK